MHITKPTVSAPLASAALVATAAAAPISVIFGCIGGDQAFTAATARAYGILAFGAQGGSTNHPGAGGLGAEVGGDWKEATFSSAQIFDTNQPICAPRCGKAGTDLERNNVLAMNSTLLDLRH